MWGYKSGVGGLEVFSRETGGENGCLWPSTAPVVAVPEPSGKHGAKGRARSRRGWESCFAGRCLSVRTLFPGHLLLEARFMQIRF